MPIFGTKVLLRRIGWSYGLLGGIFWDASLENTSAYSVYSSGSVTWVSSAFCANLLAIEVFAMVRGLSFPLIIWNLLVPLV